MHSLVLRRTYPFLARGQCTGERTFVALLTQKLTFSAPILDCSIDPHRRNVHFHRYLDFALHIRAAVFLFIRLGFL
jgi:hypothetical protein